MKSVLNIKSKLAVAFGALAVLASCQKGDDNTNGKNDFAYLSPDPLIISSVDNEDDNQTKGLVMIKSGSFGHILGENASNYPYIHKFGFFVMKAADTSTPHADYYRNMFGEYKLDNPLTPGNDGKPKWLFDLSPTQKHNRIPLFKHDGAIELSAYYPYTAAATDITQIPFDVVEKIKGTSAINDYMWAAPKVIDPLVPAELNAELSFKHAMSAIVFRMSTSFIGTVTLSDIVIETADGGQWLPLSGTYNGQTGDVNVLTGTNKLVISHNRALPAALTHYSAFYPVILPEIATTNGQADRKLKVTLVLNKDGNQTDAYGGSFEIDLGTVKNVAGQYGLRTGYRYTVEVKIDNYIKIENFENLEGEDWLNEFYTIDI